MTGIALVVAFVIAIVLMIVMISKLKIHPFVSIMLISLAFGLVAGIPLVNTTATDGTVFSVTSERLRVTKLDGTVRDEDAVPE